MTYFGDLRSSEVYDLPKLFGVKNRLHSLLQRTHKITLGEIIIIIITFRILLYLGLNTQSAVLYYHWILSKLFKQILPLTGQLAKCAFGHKKYSPKKKEQIKYKRREQ